MTSKHEIKIVDTVPIPTGPIIRKKAKYPFEDMKKVGHSFFVAGVTPNAMQSAVHRFRTQHAPDCSYTVRQVSEVVEGEEARGEQLGVRVWRTT
jgi:hypothetical protein